MIKTLFSEGRKVASSVKDSIVPVNIIYHGVIPGVIVFIVSLLVSIFLIKIPISGEGTINTCTKWSDSSKKHCIKRENRPYNRRWNLLGYVILIPLLSLFVASLWYKMIFYAYNPYVAAASYTFKSFR